MIGGPQGRLPSSRQHSFAVAPQARQQRSVFDRSHTHKTTIDFSTLYPIFVDEVLPGDSFNLNLSMFARLTTPIVPIMDNCYIDFHFFFVPHRLVWANFEKFMGAQDNPGDSTDYTLPTVSLIGAANGETWDYFGLPTGIGAGTLNVQNLIGRAHNLIWNEWYRDENLQNSITVDTDDGPDTASDYALLQPRGKRHDYFSSCLPWPQKATAVSLPLGTSAPIYGINQDTYAHTPADTTDRKLDFETTTGEIAGTTAPSATAAMRFSTDSAKVGLEADLSAATAATINAFREAMQLQRFYERDARGGTRYTEIVRSHFGVISPDARLQRPEFLGGSTRRINFAPIPQTSATDTGTSSQTPQGNLAAFATSDGSGIGFVKSFTEHGTIIGFVSARSDMTYQQGINRMWNRSTREDFYWPVFAHLGEQEVLNKEIFADGTPANDDGVFGYQERWAEYRYKPSMVTGIFRSNATGSLDYWHLAYDFASLPALDSTFIVEQVPQTRVMAAPTEPAIIMDMFFSYKCARSMPVFSVPGLVDHF